jgi:tetratricopeptide (TPR) repeat protein
MFHRAGTAPRCFKLSAFRALVTFSLLLGAQAAPAAEEDADAARPMSAARDLYLSGHYEEAAQAHAQLADRSAADTVNLARCKLAVGDRDGAETLLVAAMRGSLKQPLFPAELALLQLDAGDYNDAKHFADQALALDDKAVAPRWVNAELHRLHGKLDEALQGYEGLVNYYSGGAAIASSEDRRLIGLAAAQYARWSRNHQQFKRLVSDFYPEILSREPKYWPAHLEMARLFAEKYNEADATAAIHAGLAINPHAADLHVLRAQLALDKFDLASARSAVERALAIHPRHVGAICTKADILLADVRPAEAIPVLEEATRLKPGDEETLGRLAAAYLTVDGVTDGMPSARTRALIEQALKQNPHAGQFYLSAGDALDRMRRFPQAVEQYRLAHQRMPQLIAVRGKLGMTLMRLGEEAEAGQLLDEAFTIDPFNVRVKNTLEVLDILKSYAVLETEHFVIKFDRGHDELLAKYAARYLERDVYPQLVEQFGFHPGGKTLIEIFSRQKNTSGHGWFSARMAGLPAIGTVGACAGRMIALTSPGELEKKFNWARVLKHEYVHVLNLQQTDFGIPHWFTEGLAVHSEGGRRPRAWNEILARRTRDKKLFDLDSLTYGFVRPASSEDWSLAYCQAALHVDYLHERFGTKAIAALLTAYSQRKTTAEAMQQALGLPQAEYEQGYNEYVAGYLAKLGLQSSREVRSLAELQQAAEQRGATAADLAALARAQLDRQNLPEARRQALAAQNLEAESPLAAYVLARIHLEIGDTEEALRVLEKGLNAEKPQEDLVGLLAAMKLQSEDLAEAERLHELGLKHFPASDRWLKGLARIHLQRQDNDKLAAVLERLAELEPDSRSIRKKLAELSLAGEDFAAAGRWGTGLIHLDVRDAEGHALLAAAARGMKDWPLAVEEYETAVALDGEQPEWKMAWAEVLLAMDKRDEARRVASELKAQAADHPGLEELLEKLNRE